MTQLNDFLALISEAKKESEEKEQILSEKFIKNNDFFNFLMEAAPLKQQEPIQEIVEEKIDQESSIQEETHQILSEKIQDNDFFNFLMKGNYVDPINDDPNIQKQVVLPIIEEIITEEPDQQVVIEEPTEEIIIEEPIVEKKSQDLLDPATYDKLFKTNVNLFDQPNLPKVSPELKAITDKVQYMENWLTKISMAGPGSGEVNLLRLDDVDTTNINDGYLLTYDQSEKKIVFSQPAPQYTDRDTLDIVTTRGNVTNNSITVNTVDFLNGTSVGGDSNGNILVVGNLIPVDNLSWSLGSANSYWNNAYIGPHSLNIMPEIGSNTTIQLENSHGVLRVKSGGFGVYSPDATYNTFYVANTGYSQFHTPSPLVGQAVVNISANPSSNVIPVANTQVGGVLHLTGANSGATLVTIDNFDNTAPNLAAGVIAFRRFRGTVDNPQPIQSGDALGGLVALGSYGNTVDPLPVSAGSSTYGRIQFIATENYTSANNGQKIIFNSVPTGSNVALTTFIINADKDRGGIQLPQSNNGITFPDNTFQSTAYNTATANTIGGVKPDNSTITINNGTITCVGVANNGTGTDYIEVYDRANTIHLSTTPILLTPVSLGSNVGISYNSSTGIFTFPTAGNYSLSLVVNAKADISGATLYIYAEQNNGSGWAVNQNSGKQFQLVNNQTTQVVYSQAVHRSAGQQVRYWIFSTDPDSKTYLQTTTLPGITPPVYVPAIRIQYS